MKIIPALLLSGAALVLLAGPASARGCNGVVNQLVWGCAAWDNNNGPQYPNWHGPAAQPARPAPTYNPPPQVVNRNGNGLISQDGGTLISPGNRNGLISQDGGTLRH